MITKAVNLWLGNGPRVVIPVSQFDTAWEFVFTIINAGTEWAIPAGANAVLNGRKPDNNVFAFAGTIANNKITVDCDVQMTAVAGDTICELSIFTTEGSEESQRAKVVGTANFVLAVEAAPNSTGATPSASDLDAYGAIISGELDTYFEQHPEMIEGKGLSEPIRLAILNCFQHVAWRDTHGQDYYDALYELLMNKEVLSITAVFDQGSAVIYDTDSLDTLKQYLTVTANYDDGTSGVVTGYTLSGTLTVGTSTITATYAGKTTTFDVAVTYKEYQYVEWINSDDADSWFVTGIIPSNTFGVKVELARPDVTVLGTVAGIRLNNGDTRCWITAPQDATNKNVRFSWNTLGNMVSANNTISNGVKFVATLNYKNDRKATLDGVDVGTNLPTLYSPFTRPFILMGKDNQGTVNGTAQKFFGAEFTLGTDVTHKFVPCYKRSNGEIGLYEEIGGQFYANNGTGTLTKGGDV